MATLLPYFSSWLPPLPPQPIHPAAIVNCCCCLCHWHYYGFPSPKQIASPPPPPQAFAYPTPQFGESCTSLVYERKVSLPQFFKESDSCLHILWGTQSCQGAFCVLWESQADWAFQGSWADGSLVSGSHLESWARHQDNQLCLDWITSEDI